MTEKADKSSTALGWVILFVAFVVVTVIQVFIFIGSREAEANEKNRLYDECASCSIPEQRMCAAHHWTSNYIINHCVQHEEKAR